MPNAFERVLRKLRKKVITFCYNRLFTPVQKEVVGKRVSSFSAQKEIWAKERIEQKRVRSWMRTHSEEVAEIKEKFNDTITNAGTNREGEGGEKREGKGVQSSTLSG